MQPNTYLSMWAALKTTSNSPLSRRAAFFAISAASSSRDSSNKNWPNGAGENSTTIKTLKGSSQRHRGIRSLIMLFLAHVQGQPSFPCNNMLKHKIWVLQTIPPWPSLKVILISYPWQSCLCGGKMLLAGDLCLITGVSDLQSTSMEPPNQSGLLGPDKAMNQWVVPLIRSA